LLDRVERLEQKIASGAPASSAPPAPGPSPNGPLLAARPRSVKAENAPPALSEPVPQEQTAPATVALDDVIEAWPATLEALKPPLRAAISDVQPIDIDNTGAVVFGVPERSYQTVNEKFRKDAATIKDALAQRLGATPQFILRKHDFSGPDALRPTSSAPPVVDDDDEDVDISELTEAPDGPPSDVLRLQDTFGAEVVEERKS
jgi:hypothetical protein